MSRPPGSNGLFYIPPRADSYKLAVILALGAFLRFFRIGQQSYWSDEVQSIWTVSGYAGTILENITQNHHGTLHFTLLWLWSKIGGWGEAWTRSLSVIAALVTFWLLYVLARRIAGRNIAIWSTLLLAISPFHIWFSQEVRNYVFLHLFSVLSMIFLLEIVDKKDDELGWFPKRERVWPWIGFILASIAALLCNLAALFLLAFQGIYILIRRPRLSLRLAVVAVLIFLVLFPWIRGLELGWTIDQITTAAPLRNVNFHPLAALFTLKVYSVGRTLGPSLHEMDMSLSFDTFRPYMAQLAASGIVFGLIFIQGLRERWRQRYGLWFFVGWIFLPMVFVSILALLNLKAYIVRYVSVGFPAFLIVLAAGLERSKTGLRIALAALVLILSFISIRNIYCEPRYWKPDVRNAVAELERGAYEKDAVVVYSQMEPFLYYYKGRCEILSIYYPPEDIRLEKMIEDLGRRFERVWLFDYRGVYLDPEGKIPVIFGERFDLVEEFRFPGVDLRLYTIPGSAR